jgi:hypothetical protein
MRLQFRAVLYFCCTFPAADCRALQLGFGLAGKDFKKSQSQSLILSQDRALPKSPRGTSRRLAKVHLRRASIVPKRFT